MTTAGSAEVRAAQDYLRRFGYLPSAELSKDYPDFRPVVDEEPTPGVYDATTEKAVRALQRAFHLPETGLIDAATTDLMNAPRCGVPDGESGTSDPTEKFKLDTTSARINKSTIKWKVTNADDMTQAQAEGAVALAFNTWAPEMDVTFVKVTGSASADIVVSFANLSDDLLGQTTSSNPTRITLNTRKSWSWDGIERSDRRDVTTIVLHEIGHALGLGHSSILSPDIAVMFPAQGSEIYRTLTRDDRAAIRSLYDKFQQVPGLANDIGVGQVSGDVWHIGTDPNHAGYRIYKWVDGGWAEASGDGGAVRVAVAAIGSPLVVDSVGNVWWHDPDHTMGGWNLIGGCARDIASGVDMSIWIVTCTPDFNGGYRVAKLTGGGFQMEAAESNALRIAVGADGRPVTALVNTVVRRRDSSDINVTGWTTVDQMTAYDVAVDDVNRPWAASDVAVSSGGGGIFIRNDQRAFALGSPPVPARHEWVKMQGAGYQISVGPRTAWIVDANLRIYKQND